MTTKGYANMYSGMPNPERELTEEEISKIEYLISQLTIPYTGSVHHKFELGGYTVSNVEKNWCIISHFTCWCSIWKDQELKNYEDTVGLIAYLEEILQPMADKHIKDSQEAMERYYEEMFGVSE